MKTWNEIVLEANVSVIKQKKFKTEHANYQLFIHSDGSVTFNQKNDDVELDFMLNGIGNLVWDKLEYKKYGKTIIPVKDKKILNTIIDLLVQSIKDKELNIQEKQLSKVKKMIG